MKKTIFIISVIVAIVSLCFGAWFLLNPCNTKDEIKADLNQTLNAMQNNKIEDSYFYGGNFLNQNDDKSSNDVSQKIMQNTTIEIVEINEAKDKSTAELNIKAPDAYKILLDCITDVDKNSETILKKFEARLNEEYPTKTFNVTVELKLIGDHWYMVPNAQLSNAFSGGLVEKYWELGKETVDLLLGEDKND